MIEEFFKFLNKYQYPDKVAINKQRSEFGVFKGFWYKCIREWINSNLTVEFDSTWGYMRIIWDFAKIPLYQKWTHVRRDEKILPPKKKKNASK